MVCFVLSPVRGIQNTEEYRKERDRLEMRKIALVEMSNAYKSESQIDESSTPTATAVASETATTTATEQDQVENAPAPIVAGSQIPLQNNINIPPPPPPPQPSHQGQAGEVELKKLGDQNTQGKYIQVTMPFLPLISQKCLFHHTHTHLVPFVYKFQFTSRNQAT